MPGIQTRSQKGKPTAKSAGRGVSAALKPMQPKTEKIPLPAPSIGVKVEKRPLPGPSISAQERELLVARAAYFRAEKRGFAPGGELQDWVEAETEVLRLIGSA